MKQSRPIMHAKDHLPGGADPIPWEQAPGGGGTTDPIDHEIPKQGTPPPGGPDLPWFWWRCRDLRPEHPASLPSPLVSTEENTKDAANQMVLTWPGQLGFGGFIAPSHEAFLSGAGPNGESGSILRLQADRAPGDTLDPNPDNHFKGACPLGAGGFPSGYSANWGQGGTWTLLGWFNFAAVGNNDVFNIAPPSGGNHTYLLTNPDGSVSLTRWGSTWTSASGLVSAGTWTYIGITLANGRLRVYVNPGPPEATDYSPVYGSDFPLDVPMVMETWGLAKGDYSAASLAAKATASGFKSVAVRLNPADEDMPPGMTHAEYITQLTADVATLQASGLQVVGWGVADSTTGADLTATGVNGWMPQIEGPGQYDSCMAALAAGVGAGLPKAVVSNFGGLEDPADVAALATAGIDSIAVEAYAEVPGHQNLTGMLWQATQQGFSAPKVIAMLGTYRGETPDDYIGLDENVVPSYGIYNAAQTSESAWQAFAQLNQGFLMLSSPVIDVADTATAAQSCLMSVGDPNHPSGTSFGADGALEGYFSEIVLYWTAVPSSGHRALSMSGSHGDTGTIPPQDQIPPASLQASQLAPGADGQHLVTDAGVAKWAPDTGGGASTLDDLTDVTATGAADNDVLTYDLASDTWSPSAGTPGPAGPTGPAGATGATGPAGATGATGATGAPGAPGAAGERWFTGPGAPSGTFSDSIVGDWYLDSANGDYYEKTGTTTWTLRGNLMGPPGSTGATGQSDVQTFTGSGTWTKPTGVEVVRVICIGAGGGGGGGGSNAGAAARSGGGGGGGGACWEETLRADDLTGTVAVTVGTGGTGGTTSGTIGSAGGNGGASSFGAYAQAGGGGGGPGGVGVSNGGGAGGSYLGSASGITSAPLESASPIGNQSGRSQGAGAGLSTEFGGASGGGGASASNAGAGGSSTRAGSGGGAGGGHQSGGAISGAGAGGLAGGNISGSNIVAGGGGTAGSGGASPTAGGAGGAVTNRLCGSGGGGGGGTSTAGTTAGAGGAGGRGSGGGGGGSSQNSTGGAGARGGDGLVVVISW